ncbi:phage baseplate assembly protein W [Paenibacillus shirakamiensis]|uniref:Phage baseplate assembly protein W n=1 Tax=Paenibacillus shirakamiensis TaxID=1265935 RepID=A0ABS4JLI8_9BACL|nr:DUF2634 domain-containing protein [Paenibacillus shirakamiensis]MBP2002563.1 phage baseplate assembly protein W [Paenibacillus shirakamiensis]
MESLRLDDHGDIQFELIEGIEELTQSCRLILSTNTGEWFLNPTLGIAFDKFMGKQVHEAEMRSELTRGLLQESRIQSVDDIQFSADEKSRTLRVSFQATGYNNEIIAAEEVKINAR